MGLERSSNIFIFVSQFKILIPIFNRFIFSWGSSLELCNFKLFIFPLITQPLKECPFSKWCFSYSPSVQWEYVLKKPSFSGIIQVS